MTKTPGESRPATPESEVLEELGDDAIIAQQAAVHLPQPRAQVEIESRSIVISDQGGGDETPTGEAEPTRELLPYAVSSVDPTVVIRDRKFINSLGGPGSSRPKKTFSAGKIALWVGAGVVAFGVGGLLAFLTTRRPAEAIEPPVVSARPTSAEEPAAMPNQPTPTSQAVPSASAAPLVEPVASADAGTND